MINAHNLGEMISRMFNFIYESNGGYYVLGRDFFRLCTDLEMEIYKSFKKSLEDSNKDWSIEQYKRVRKYVSDCQPSNKSNEKNIVRFVCELNEMDLKSLESQVNQAIEYASIAYKWC